MIKSYVKINLFRYRKALIFEVLEQNSNIPMMQTYFNFDNSNIDIEIKKLSYPDLYMIYNNDREKTIRKIEICLRGCIKNDDENVGVCNFKTIDDAIFAETLINKAIARFNYELSIENIK